MKYIKNKWNQLVGYIKRRDLQFVISASFTLVALIGMVFIGVFLYQSYGRAAKEMMLNDTRQLVNQVEINLNNYLRNCSPVAFFICCSVSRIFSSSAIMSFFTESSSS